MKFIDIKDENGTSLQSYAELLIEKAKALGFTAIIVFGSKERKLIHAFTSTDGSVPHTLISVGKSLLAEPEPVNTAELVTKPN